MLINTYEISVCHNCGVMTYTLMDDEGNRICGKCKMAKEEVK